jgi:hypothetical protein
VLCSQVSESYYSLVSFCRRVTFDKEELAVARRYPERWPRIRVETIYLCPCKESKRFQIFEGLGLVGEHLCLFSDTCSIEQLQCFCNICKAFLTVLIASPVPKIQSCLRKEDRRLIEQIIRSIILFTTSRTP